MLRNLNIINIQKNGDDYISISIYNNREDKSSIAFFDKEDAKIILEILEAKISLEKVCESPKKKDVSLEKFLSMFQQEGLPKLSEEHKIQLERFVYGEVKQPSRNVMSATTEEEEESSDRIKREITSLSGYKAAPGSSLKMCVADKSTIQTIFNTLDPDYSGDHPIARITWFNDIINIKFYTPVFIKSDILLEQSLLHRLGILSTFPNCTYSLDFSSYPLSDKTLNSLITCILNKKINIYSFALEKLTLDSCQPICNLIQGTAIKVLSVPCESSSLIEISEALYTAIEKNKTLLEVDFHCKVPFPRIERCMESNLYNIESQARDAANSQEERIAKLMAENKRLTDTIEKLDATHEELCDQIEKLQAKSSESRPQQETDKKKQKLGFFDRDNDLECHKDLEYIRTIIERCKKNKDFITANILTEHVKGKCYEDAIKFISLYNLDAVTPSASLSNKK